MTNIELVKEKSSKEMIAEGGGMIPVGFNILSGTVGEPPEDTFYVMLSGSKLYFSFGKGQRRVSADISNMISEAYPLAMEE